MLVPNIFVYVPCIDLEGLSNQFVSGIMALVIGIITKIRLTRNMLKKITEVTFLCKPCLLQWNDE